MRIRTREHKKQNKKDLDIRFLLFSVLSFILLPTILYSNFGFLGCIIGILISLGIIFALWFFYRILIYNIKTFGIYIGSKNMFHKKHINIDYYIGERDNIQNSVSYYNIKNLKKQFQQHLFWKNIGDTVSLSLVGFILMIIFLAPSGLLFATFISIFSTLALLLLTMKEYFYFLYYKHDIEFIPLSSNPKHYMYAGSTIFFY